MMYTNVSEIKEFITFLAHQKVSQSTSNQYALNTPVALQVANRIRRENLQQYLLAMHRLRPGLLLVGEAPGYRGCRQTGIPFSSEALLAQWIQEGCPLSQKQHYYQIPESKDKLLSEATATIVWNTLPALPTFPLLWNAYPFHPHLPGKPRSNRPPNAAELASGSIVLKKFLQLFPIQTVIAVGRTAEKTLEMMGIPTTYVRHPARGGKTEFKRGMRNLCQNVYNIVNI